MSLAQSLEILKTLSVQDRQIAAEYGRKRGVVFGAIFLLVLGIVILSTFAAWPGRAYLLAGLVILLTIAILTGILVVAYFLIRKPAAVAWLASTPQNARTYYTQVVVPKLLATRYQQVREASPGTLVRRSRVLSMVDTYTARSSSGELTAHRQAAFDWQELRGRVEDEWEFRDERRLHSLAEIHVEKQHKNEEREWWESLGTWLVVSSTVDHEFTGETLVLHKQVFAANHQGLQKVTLESPDFARAFLVYSDNQREARVCLKTNVMEALTNLSQNYTAIFVEFKNQRVLVGLRTTSRLFDFDLQRDYTEADLQEALQVVHALASLSEDLNINHEYLYR